MGKNADEIIELLKLKELPGEGGLFSEVYRSNLLVPVDRMERAASTAIYYMLKGESYSAMHRLLSDEIWHFYSGDPVKLLLLHADGSGEERLLGTDFGAGEVPMCVVPKGTWQGAKLLPGGKAALMGCTVAPGFEFVDFELGQRAELLKQYPNWQKEIVALTGE